MFDIKKLKCILHFTEKVTILKAQMRKICFIFTGTSRPVWQFKGFVLIEVVIAMAIFLLILSVMFTMLVTGKTAWWIGDARIQLQQELRKGRDGLVEELRQAGISTISVPADGNPYNTITFQIPIDVVNGNIVWSEQIQYLVGGLGSEQLLRISDGEQRVLANNIVSFEISRQPTNPYIIEMVLQANKTTSKGTEVSGSLDFQVKIRN